MGVGETDIILIFCYCSVQTSACERHTGGEKKGSAMASPSKLSVQGRATPTGTAVGVGVERCKHTGDTM